MYASLHLERDSSKGLKISSPNSKRSHESAILQNLGVILIAFLIIIIFVRQKANVLLDNIHVIHETLHCLHIDLVSNLTLLANFFELWYLTFSHDLIVED